MVDLSHQIDILPSLFVLESIISNEFPILPCKRDTGASSIVQLCKRKKKTHVD